MNLNFKKKLGPTQLTGKINNSKYIDMQVNDSEND